MYKLQICISEARCVSVWPYTQDPVSEGKAVAPSAASFPADRDLVRIAAGTFMKEFNGVFCGFF